MMRLGVPKAELGPIGISRQKMKVERKAKAHNGKINDKLYQLMKEERYTDVTLKFDDGKKMSCHRCVLASSSEYFDCMFSNGMRESNADVVEVVGVTSAIMSIALEFMYTGQCECVFEDFFDLLLLANMYELRDFEASLLDLVVQLDRDRGNFLERGTKTRNELETEVLDFLVEVWVFCRRYPVIAGSLKVFKEATIKTPLKEYIIKSLAGAPRYYWGSMLSGSKNLMSLDFESFRDFLTDTNVTDHNSKLSFDVTSAWLTNQSAPNSRPAQEDDEDVDMDDSSKAEPDSRLSHFVELMGDLRLQNISRNDTLPKWGVDSLKEYRDRIEDMRQTRKKWNLVIMSIPSCDASVKFICHDMDSGESFCLDPPTYDFPESELFGTPKLMIQDKSLYLHSKEVVHSLYCVRGLRQKNRIKTGKDDPQEKRLSIIRHEYSFTRKQWFLNPEKATSTGDLYNSQWPTIEEKVPLHLVEFLVPNISTVNDMLFVRLSHDFEKEAKPDAEQNTEKVSLTTPPPLQEKSLNEGEGADHQDKYTDRPSRNMAEVFSYEVDVPVIGLTEKNLWQCRVPNFEVLGVGVYKKKNRSNTGVALFGNSYVTEGQEQKETMVLLNSVRKQAGFPEGVCDSPLSVVSLSDYIFMVPSSPYVTICENGTPTIRLPKVHVFNPHARFSPSRQDWVYLPTPTCPDLEYASLYYDSAEGHICLVLVQKPSSKAPYSEIFKSSLPSNLPASDRIETRSKQGRRGGGGKKFVPPPKKDPPKALDGRVVARYRLLLTGSECFTTKKKMKNTNHVWKPLKVSDATADFFALGSKTPGEVRIISTQLNINNLTKVQLNSIGVDEVEETTKMEEGSASRSATSHQEPCASQSGAQHLEPWVNHQDSIYQSFFHKQHNRLEKKAKQMSSRTKELIASVKPRKLEHALMNETPLEPSHPTIKFKMTQAYSTESLNRDYSDYEDGDDDDEYGSSESDFYTSRGFGGGLFYDHYDYDSDSDILERYLHQW